MSDARVAFVSENQHIVAPFPSLTHFQNVKVVLSASVKAEFCLKSGTACSLGRKEAAGERGDVTFYSLKILLRNVFVVFRCELT